MLSSSGRSKKGKLAEIKDVARRAGIPAKYVEIQGRYKAKINLDFLKGKSTRHKGKYILVSAITPSPFGEGKTVTTIGLSMALNRMGKKSIVCLRQPSMGPIFGAKGVGTGGGRSQVLPNGDINLHFTGDIHAVGVAHNILAAFLDNSIFRGNKLDINPKAVMWRRVLDINDRSLRNVKIGLGESGSSRDSGFDITVASELMAILALSRDIEDMRRRLDRVVVALTTAGKPVTAKDLNVAGAMAALLKEAIKPNLVQTTEQTPCLIHTGPFANIAHGNSSIIADKMALAVSDYVVTESGFGADLGGEKFFDIKCRTSGLVPDAAVLVSTVRSLKMHGGKFKMIAGKPVDKKLFRENLGALEKGCANLERQIKNIKKFGIPVVVVINKFSTDTAKEIILVRKKALLAGADDAVVSELWERGSKGGTELAKAVILAAGSKNRFKFLYGLNSPIKDKIEKIAKEIYGATRVIYSTIADSAIARYEKLGYGKLPVCIAKTHLSLSADPSVKGAPKGFTLPVRDVHLSAGAGFITPICGTITTMPGLPANPIGTRIDIDKKGDIIGLS
ncbi:MAG: formate--tetrahydrofolate ligase [Candidatus Omnitrophica bacterium]|nr:formate--tetrahydrofolate ligase [Candidatus Omnitrophota bacterium]